MESDENIEAAKFAMLIARKAKISRITANSKWCPPQLKYTRKLLNDWGQVYISALQEALFTITDKSYIPDPAPQFSDNNEPIQDYACEICNDRFYIESSLEDHITRGSWILGYWCSYCFVSCKHGPDATSCDECRLQYFNKHSALHKRGLKRGRIPGVVNIFFNQCEFFEHLRMHGIASVLAKEIMLMPFPSGVQKEHYTQLKLLCEAVMDRMFILNVHIQNWFVDNCVPKNWWRVKNAQVDRMVKMYNKNYEWIDNCKETEEEMCLTISKNKKTQDIYKNIVCNGEAASNCVVDSDSDFESERNSSDCTTDITFVDCGSCESVRCDAEMSLPWQTSTQNKRYILPALTNSTGKSPMSAVAAPLPKISVKNFANTNAKIPSLVKSPMPSQTSTSQSPSLLAKMFKITSPSPTPLSTLSLPSSPVCTPSNVLVTNAQSTSTPSTPKSKSVLSKRGGKGLVGQFIKRPKGEPAPKFTPGPRVVAVQTSNSIDLNSIMKKLPPDIANSKKIVFIGKDSSTIINPGQTDIQENNVNFGVKTPITNDPKFLTGQKLLLKSIPIQQISVANNVVIKNQDNGAMTSSSLLRQTVVNKAGGKMMSPITSIRPKQDDKATNNTCIPSFSSFVKQPLNMKVGNSSGMVKQVNNKTSLLKTIETVNNDKKANIGEAVNISVKKSLSPKSSSDLFFVSVHQASKAILDRFFNENQQKFLTIVKCSDGKLYLTFKKNIDLGDPKTLILKYRQWILSHYNFIGTTVLQSMIEHFRDTGKKFLAVMNMSNHEIVDRHNEVLTVLERALEFNKFTNRNFKSDAEYQCMLERWETDSQKLTNSRNYMAICFTCQKILKPKTYLMGLSAKARDESKYCSCYNCICYKCQISVGSLPHYRAHMHYHKNIAPFRCPECLQNFPSSASLEAHFWSDCFHPITRRIWSCNICLTSGFCSVEAIMQHFALMHCDIKIACGWCRTVFNQHYACWVHMKQGHPTIKQIGQPLRLIVCQIDKCAVPIECFRFHMEDHMGVEEVVHYRCPKCVFSTTEKKIIKTHILENHFAQLSGLMSNDAFNEFMASYTRMPKIVSAHTISPEVFEQNIDEHMDNAVNQNTQVRPNATDFHSNGFIKLPNVRSVGECSNTFQVRRHITKNAVKRNESSPNNCIRKFNSYNNVSRSEAEFQNDSDDESADDPLQALYPSEAFDDSLVENLLEDEFVISPQTARRLSDTFGNDGRIRIALNGPNSIDEIHNFNCHICGELINTSWSVVCNHFNTKHKQNYELRDISPQIIPLEDYQILDEQHLIGTKRKSDGLILNNNKRRKRWTPKKHVEKNYISPERPTGICIEVESPVDGDGHYKCKKCNETFGKINDLREHIAKTHRMNNGYLVCLECGQNFVVAPSLHMHMKAFHGIEDPEFYLSQNTRCAPAIIDLEAKAKVAVPNQCYVCMAVFKDKATVDKHLRVHGMAFLNRKFIEGTTRTVTLDSDTKSIDGIISYGTENGVKRKMERQVETSIIRLECESS